MKKLKQLKSLIDTLEIVRVLSTLGALVYMVGWGVQLISTELFEYYKERFGGLPQFFDDAFHFKIYFLGNEHTAGFVMAAVFCIVLFLYAHDQLKKLKPRYSSLLEEENMKEAIEHNKMLLNKDIKKQPAYKAPQSFCALFEFNFENTSISEAKVDFEKLKNDFSTMMIEKLKAKYNDYTLSLEDGGMFVVFKNFKRVHSFVKDTLKLYQALVEVNNKRLIDTSMLFSFWTKQGVVDSKVALDYLKGMNNLNFYNKIIVNEAFHKHYELTKEEGFNFLSMGCTKLFNFKGNGNDVDIELYRLLNT